MLKGLDAIGRPLLALDLGVVAERVATGGFPRQPGGTVAQVAVLSLVGVMSKNGGYGCSTDALREEIDQVMADDQVKVVVLRVDSPGGTVQGTDALASSVSALNAVKPVMAMVDGACCSAAYWVACNASEIWATKDSFVGSIGTMMSFTDVSKALADHGVAVDLITSGPLKGTGVFGTALTDEQREHLQQLVDYQAGQFKSQVSAARKGVDIEAVSTGAAWFAGQALEMKLIDRIGSDDQCLAEALEAATLLG